MRRRTLLHQSLAIILSGAMACGSLLPPAVSFAQTVSRMDTTDTALSEVINVPGGNNKISIDVTDENIRAILRNMSEQAGFNLLIDDSVTGNVTLQMNDVTINQALQSVATLSDIQIIPQSGNIYLAMSRFAVNQKGIGRQLSKVIKIYYSNASRIAGLLNKSIFALDPASMSGGASGGSGTSTIITKVQPDPRTNSVIIVGTAQEIKLAEEAIARLDVPRQSKTFYLSHANALQVATMLASSIFNDGKASLTLGGSSSGGGGSTSSLPAQLRVEKEDVEEGEGVHEFGGGSSGSSGSSAGLSTQVTLRGTIKKSETLSVSPEGPLVVPDTRQNSVTVMGTAEQIAAAEALIPTLDAQLPQVSIEASLVEINSTGQKELGMNWGSSDGRWSWGFNNEPLEGLNASNRASGNLIGLRTIDPTDTASLARSGIRFSTNPVEVPSDMLAQLRTLVSERKAKILANPTIVATHDTESIISIVDEIVRRVTTTIDESGFATQTVEIGEAGIVLDILPKVGEDGTISMRLRPSVTSVRDRLTVAGNTVTLLSKRDLLTENVRIRDGETLAIGGLIKERSVIGKDKLPLLGDSPIIGAMFRASTNTAERSELVLLITPHVLSKTQQTQPQTLTMPIGETSMAGGVR